MSEKLVAPDVKRMIADLQNRVGILERRVTSRPAQAVTVETLVFSYAGALAASTSPPARLRAGGILSILAVTLGTAGATDTVLDVYRNGALAATVTVPDGATAYNAEVGVRFTAESDQLVLAIATPGTGAADMTAEARFI